METITRKKRRSTNKSPEITRLIQFMDENNLKAADLAASVDVAERTITNYIWNDTPIGGQLLRQLLLVHGVSIDWMITGEGEMYVNGKMSESEELPDANIRGEKRLIEQKQALDNESMPDVYLIFASVIEQSLIDAGAEPEKDYTYMDLYKLAQAHVIEEAKKTELKVQIIAPSDRS